jgi:hypothetical protein
MFNYLANPTKRENTSAFNVREIYSSAVDRKPQPNIIDFLYQMFDIVPNLSQYISYYEHSMSDFLIDSSSSLGTSTANSHTQIDQEIPQAIYKNFTQWVVTTNNLLIDIQQKINIEKTVIKKFEDIAEISQIFLEENESGFALKVFIQVASYNDALMDNLLDREISVLKSFPLVCISFDYLPFISNAIENGIISDNDRLIYSR